MSIITKHEYINFISMFNGADEDFNLAFECFTNSSYDSETIIACIIARRLVFKKRKQFIDNYNSKKSKIMSRYMISVSYIKDQINLNKVRGYI